MKHSHRRIVASLSVIAFLIFWIWAAATLGTYLATAPKWLTAIFFIVAGIGWAIPLKPVFGWMNSGPEDEPAP
ncbi:MAG: DUF2842 domain-containing protein [Pseudomonadota bacterium]